MTWVKVDDSLPNHPKFIGMSDAALAAWLRGLLYSSAYLLDGFVPAHAVSVIGKPKACAELVARGAWLDADAGWLIANYAEHQRTREEVDRDRAKKAKAGSKGNHARWHVALGVTEPGCRYCDRTSIAGATPCDPDATRTRSPETETETEENCDSYLARVQEPSPDPVDNPVAHIAEARSALHPKRSA